MNIDANIAVHLSIGPKVNGQRNFIGFIVFFTSIWLVTLGMLVISVQCCGKILSTLSKCVTTLKKS